MATKILVADDNAQITTLLDAILKAEGYEVLVADNGEDALALARKHLPALVLSDIKMPKKDGITLCKDLRSDERTRQIPIIMLSSAGQLAEIEQALASGAGSYITKPTDRQHILDCVRAALNRSGEPDWLHAKRKTR